MKTTIVKIFLFMLAVVGTYAYVGQLVPQFEEHPPVKKVITPQTPPQELATIGQELLRNKGGCLICHKDAETGNERGPDLRQAASKAPTRKSGISGEAYLLESIIAPEAFIVPGYSNMMPPARKPPANLSMAEVKALAAYLQWLGGGEVTVKVLPEDVTEAKRVGPQHLGKTLAGRYGCTGCHMIEGEGGVIGPDLTKIAMTREPADILRKINDPTVWSAPGFPVGVMPSDYAKTIPEGDRAEIVGYLANLSGKSYSPTGAASPWSHEGVRLGLVILVFNLGMLAALALVGRRARNAAVV